MDQNNIFMGDAEFERYLRSIQPDIKFSVATQLDALPLGTPEGVEVARRILEHQMDFKFRNKENITGEQIQFVSELLKEGATGQSVNPETQKIVYERRIGPRKYVVIAPPAETLARYKTQIDTIIAILKTGDKENIAKLLTPGILDGSGKGTSKRKRGSIDDIMQELNSGAMGENRFALLAIAIFTGVNRSKGLAGGATNLKLYGGGQYLLADVLDKDGRATCIDVNLLNKQLAKMYGIESDVCTIGEGRTTHRLLVTSTNEVIDAWVPGLYYSSLEEYRRSVQPGAIRKENYNLEL